MRAKRDVPVQHVCSIFGPRKPRWLVAFLSPTSLIGAARRCRARASTDCSCVITAPDEVGMLQLCCVGLNAHLLWRNQQAAQSAPVTTVSSPASAAAASKNNRTHDDASPRKKVIFLLIYWNRFPPAREFRGYTARRAIALVIGCTF